MIHTGSDHFVAVAARLGHARPRTSVGALRWWVRACAVGLAAVLPGRAGGQAVTLRIAPPVGATLRMRLDQRVEMSGTTRMPAGDSTATVVTTLLVISRAFVERRDRDATIVLASTDSVAAWSNG